MKRFVALGMVGVLLVSATGCGGPDSLMKELIANLNAYAGTLEKKESRERQLAALDRIRGTVEKMNKLKLSKEEQDKLFAKHDADFKAAKERIKAAQKTYVMEGGGADAPELFDDAGRMK